MLAALTFACVLQTPPAEVWDIVLTPDGKEFIACHLHDKLTVWDVQSGDLKRTIAVPEKGDFGVMAVSLAFSPNGKLLAVGNALHDNGTASVMEWPSGKVIASPAVYRQPNFAQPPRGVSFSGDGRYLFGDIYFFMEWYASYAWDTSTWNVKFWEPFGRASCGLPGKSAALVLHKYGEEDDPHDLDLWNVEGKDRLGGWHFELPGKGELVLEPDPEGKRVLAALGESALIASENPQDGEDAILVKIQTDGLNVRSAAWSPDGSSLYIGGLEGHLAKVDPATGKILQRTILHETRHIRAIAATMDLVITGSGGFRIDHEGGLIEVVRARDLSRVRTIKPPATDGMR